MHYIGQQDDINVSDVIEECLSTLSEYSTVLRDRLVIHTTIKKFPKGSFIIKEGQYLKGGYSIVSGCVKEFYYNNNSEQKVSHFYVENDVMPLALVDKEIKVNYYWECLEDTIVTFETISNRQQLFREFPFLFSMSFQFMQQSFIEYRESTHQFILSNPEERYLNLIKNKPELVNRLPQYEIANYIGIKAESLSRIRRRLYDFERN
jgi:CRP-like cAMP-binding protein